MRRNDSKSNIEQDTIRTSKIFPIFPRSLKNRQTGLTEYRWLEVAYIDAYYDLTEYGPHWHRVYSWNDDCPKDARFSIWSSIHVNDIPWPHAVAVFCILAIAYMICAGYLPVE